MSEWLNALAPARPAGPGLAGAVGTPSPIQPPSPPACSDAPPLPLAGPDPGDPAGPPLARQGSRRHLPHPGLSETLRSRIAREFMPR